MILSICLCVCPCGCLWLCRSRCLALRQLRKALTSASADAKFPFSLTVMLTWSARRSEHQSRQLFLVHPPRRALFLSPIGLWTACSSEDPRRCPFLSFDTPQPRTRRARSPSPSRSTRRSTSHVEFGAPLHHCDYFSSHVSVTLCSWRTCWSITPLRISRSGS